MVFTNTVSGQENCGIPLQSQSLDFCGSMQDSALTGFLKCFAWIPNSLHRIVYHTDWILESLNWIVFHTDWILESFNCIAYHTDWILESLHWIFYHTDWILESLNWIVNQTDWILESLNWIVYHADIWTFEILFRKSFLSFSSIRGRWWISVPSREWEVKIPGSGTMGHLTLKGFNLHITGKRNSVHWSN